MKYDEFINPNEDDIYDYEMALEYHENDEIDSSEAGFMLGYLGAITS